jgi:hypothetical protein
MTVEGAKWRATGGQGIYFSLKEGTPKEEKSIG